MAISDIEDKLVGVPWRTCATCHYMAERGDEWADTLRGLLRNRGVKFKDIAAELRGDPDEPDIPEDALSRHARGLCKARESLR